MAWDRTSPAASSALSSSPVRANFQAIDSSNWGPNWCMDPYFLIWAAGDAAPPTHYGAVVGSGGSVARDTTDYQSNGMAMKITLGSEDTYVPQTIFSSSEFPTYWRSKEFSFSCAVKTSVASLGKIGIYDGVGTTFSSYHTGGGSWEWLTVTRTLDASATELQIRFQADIDGSSGAVTFDLPTFIPGPIPPQYFLPCPTLEGVLYFPVVGAFATETDKFRFNPEYPMLVRNVTVRVDTAPTGTGSNIAVDANHWDGSAMQSMFSTTKAEVDPTENSGGLDPDGTYRYRCFAGMSNDESETDAHLSIDIDEVGSTVAGSDGEILVRVLQFQRPHAGMTI